MQAEAIAFLAEIKTNPVIDDLEQYSSIVGPKLNIHIFGQAVLHHIVQRFLHNAIQAKRGWRLQLRQRA